MARLRDSYAEFTSRGAEILAVGPDKLKPFAKYWHENRIPFVGLPDPKHHVAKLYKQEVNLFKLGRMPAQVLIDKAGVARFVHYGHNMQDIPPNEEILALADQLNAERNS